MQFLADSPDGFLGAAVAGQFLLQQVAQGFARQVNRVIFPGGCQFVNPGIQVNRHGSRPAEQEGKLGGKFKSLHGERQSFHQLAKMRLVGSGHALGMSAQ